MLASETVGMVNDLSLFCPMILFYLWFILPGHGQIKRYNGVVYAT